MQHDDLSEPFAREEISWARRLIDEYAFTLRDIPEMIHVRIYRVLGETWIQTEQSHYMQAPGMATPAVSDTGGHSSPEAALKEVITELLEGYNAARAAGHTPDENWLLPNRDFR